MELAKARTDMAQTTIFTSRESAKFATLDAAQNGEESGASRRLIEVSFRSPARYAACMIPNDAWNALSSAVSGNPTYLTLLSAVLEKAAKSILAARLENMSVFPSEIDDSIFSADAILSEAAGNNTEWMSKEELTAAWERSATRAKLVGGERASRYAGDANYRKAVNAYADMVLKLAGKTTVYKPSECDQILAKMEGSDLDTEMGAFIVRRLEQIRNKPARSEIDLDCL